MPDKTSTAIVMWTTAAVCVATVSLAQSHRHAVQRFTFAVANAGKPSPSGDARLELVIERWSNEAERERALSAMKEKGAGALTDEVRSSGAVGYMHWPGNLDYTLRYAYRVSRPDGGQDLVLATDSPVRLWWNSDSSTSTPASYTGITIIQLRLNDDGQGEGKLAMPTKVTADREAKTLYLADYDKQPVALTDIRRDHVKS